MRKTRFKHDLATLLCTLLGTTTGCAYADLPTVLDAQLSASGLATDQVGLWIAKADGSHVAASHNADTLMQPASSIKIVTTLAGLELLSPAYAWKTHVYLDRLPDQNGTASGLRIRGGGDPHLVIEKLWLIVQRLRSMGVKTLDGDIVLDRTLFDVKPEVQGAFDGAATRSYNVGPDALLTNFKSVSLHFEPDATGKTARVTMVPALSGIRVDASVPVKPGSCSDWKTRLKADFSNPERIRFKGALPAGCGERQWHLSRWPANEYFTRVFRALFEQAGGTWNGKARDGVIAREQRPLFTHASAPLSHMTDYINKFSNNPMARHLFLTLSFADAKGMDEPASLERSRRVLADWLRDKSIDPTTIYVDNGSGLSRQTRTSAETLGRVLVAGWRSAVMPEFVGSLPMAGVDGTLKRRAVSQGSVHAKTGYLANARSLAGYVTDVNGERWVVSVMVNAPRPDGAKAFIDGVLDWVSRGAVSKR